MRKIVKRSLIASGIFILAGASLGMAGRLLGGNSGFYLSSNGLYTIGEARRMNQTHTEVLEKTKIDDITDLAVTLEYHDILIVDSGDDHFYLEYRIPQAAQAPEYSVTDQKLVFTYEEVPGDRNVFSSAPLQFMVTEDVWTREQGYVKLYIPKGSTFHTVSVYSSDSKVESTGFTADWVDITEKYGSTYLSKVRAKELFIDSSDSEITVLECQADTCSMKNTYGTVNLDGLVADTLSINSSDGKIRMSDITSKNFTVTNKYGRIEGDTVAAESFITDQSDGSLSMTGLDVKHGDFTNTYGNIKLELIGKEEDYNYDLRTKYGSINVNDRHYGEEEDGEYTRNNHAGRDVKVRGSDAGIQIETEE